nr:Fic family protein [uncultured Rhodopila sp.]
MDALLAPIARKKQQLLELRPLSPGALQHLQKHYDIELTYNSNAIEGNSLTLRETAEVIEHGVPAGDGQPKDHLEAVDHYDAVLWVRELAAQTTPINEAVVRELHRRIVARSEPHIAGVYSAHRRRIAGSPVVFPNPQQVPDLMQELGRRIEHAGPAPAAAFDAHFRLAAIHPFADGNGRTARLLMNLLLIRWGYVPISVRPADRNTYLDALEQGSLAGDVAPFQAFMHHRLDEALTDYIAAVRKAQGGRTG